MSRKLSDLVVVITGASSGIGRAAAWAFAQRGATVVLAARREAALRQAALECQVRGGRALVVPTDVTDEEAVQHLARQVVENYGRIDVWVNNAAVSLFGRFEEVPMEDFRRVIETNLFGYVYGARATLPYFREQGSGTLINVGSVVSKIPQPYTTAYVCSKYAIQGLSECLRMELSLDDAPGIRVCTVLPAAIDTPIFQQAGNYTGRAIKPLDPLYSAEKVARAIVKVAQRPTREVIVGGAGRFAIWFKNVAPGLYERLASRQIAQHHLQDRPASPSHGSLFEPMPQYGEVSGGWQKEERFSLGQWAWMGAAVAVSGLAYLARNRGILAEKPKPQRPKWFSTARTFPWTCLRI